MLIWYRACYQIGVAKLITMHERHQLILPFQRIGLEKHREGMDPRVVKLVIDPGAIPEKTSDLVVWKFLVDPSIEKDLMVSLSIKSKLRTSSFTTASLMTQPFARAIFLRQEDLGDVFLRVKATRDLEIMCGLGALVSAEMEALASAEVKLP